MEDKANGVLIVNFEEIQITHFSKRGLGSEIIKDLNVKGIKRIGDLKGRELKQLIGSGREYLLEKLAEILCVIGIEMGIESSYFSNYSFMSQYEKALNEMRSNPLSIPLSCLEMDINISRKLRYVGIGRITDIIGKGIRDVTPSGIGEKRKKELVEALKKYNVVLKDGKFFEEPETVNLNRGKVEEDQSPTAEQQLEELLELSRQVAKLGTHAIEKAEAALKVIIEEERGKC